MRSFLKRLGYREREVEKREAVAVAEPATPVTATAPATATAAPAGAASAVLDAYIIHWNTRRRRVKLKGLTLEEFRSQSLVA